MYFIRPINQVQYQLRKERNLTHGFKALPRSKVIREVQVTAVLNSALPSMASSSCDQNLLSGFEYASFMQSHLIVTTLPIVGASPTMTTCMSVYSCVLPVLLHSQSEYRRVPIQSTALLRHIMRRPLELYPEDGELHQEVCSPRQPSERFIH